MCIVEDPYMLENMPTCMVDTKGGGHNVHGRSTIKFLFILN